MPKFLIQILNPKISPLGLEAEKSFCLALAKETLACDGIFAINTGLSEPVLNVVMDAQVSENEIEEKIDAVIHFFKSRQVKWMWLVSPLSKPNSLNLHLQKKQFTLLEEVPGMYADLTQTFSGYSLENFKIVEADANDHLHDWIKPLSIAFPSTDAGEAYRELNAKTPHGPGTAFRHFVGYHNEIPVSGITLFLAKDSVMIHNLGTHPDFGKRGYAGALCKHVMKIAKDLGYKHCFLDASEKGYQLYLRLGFKIYTVYQNYVYQPE